jgi:predicted nucleotidyltransferase
MSPLSRETIQRIIIETLKPWGVLRISIFGSFARGDHTDSSDIDILVKLPPGTRRPLLGLKWFELDQELESKLGRRVDLVSEDALASPLREIVEKDRVMIYEKAG